MLRCGGGVDGQGCDKLKWFGCGLGLGMLLSALENVWLEMNFNIQRSKDTSNAPENTTTFRVLAPKA